MLKQAQINGFLARLEDIGWETALTKISKDTVSPEGARHQAYRQALSEWQAMQSSQPKG